MQGKGEGISLTPHYHFHPLHRQLDISRAITAESSPLHGFSHQFLIIRKNATKPIVWGKPGNPVATGFGLTLSVYDILDLGLRNTQH